MSSGVDKKTFEALVDKVLEYNSTPRRELYEYPYNSFQSDDILRKAEKLVRNMLGILDEHIRAAEGLVRATVRVTDKYELGDEK